MRLALPLLSIRPVALTRRLRILIALILAVLLPSAWAALPIERWTTASGAKVLFVRSDAIPMIDLAIHFDAGGRRTPTHQAGLASLAAELLDAGSGELDEDTIADRFARTGAQRSASASADGASVTLRSLSSDRELDAALGLLSRILSSPSYPQAVLDRERARMIARLREADTQPGSIVRRRFAEQVFGDHPYGRSATEASLSAITRPALLDFHARHYIASRAVIVMIGAVSRPRAESIAETLSSGLPTGEPGALPVAEAPAPEPRVLRVAHPASQSHILIGARGIAYGDPDLLALQLANHVLGGGGFTSRLYAEIREKRGLAYSVYSYFSPGMQPGPFTIGLQTRKDQADQALEVVRATLDRFVREGPSEAELDAARANLIAGFPLRLDSNRKILGQLSLIGLHDLPADWLERWTERLAAVSRDQVMKAIARHIDPGRMVTVVVGAPDPVR